MSLQLAVIMVPVLLGMMGFAIDLGCLYLIRGELNQAASAMALAAAAQLVGTSASLDNATSAAQQSLDNTNNLANKYNFGSLEIGQTTGNLTSTVKSPGLFRHRRRRHRLLRQQRDAGRRHYRAPLCTACGIGPFAVAALDASDTVNLGCGNPTAGTLYTLAFECTPTFGPTGVTAPPALVGTVVQYVIINRYDTASALDQTQQLYEDGAQGLVASLDPNPTGSPVPLACAGINDASETIWASAVPTTCTTVALNASVSEVLCGLYSRFNNSAPPAVCSTDVTDFADLSAAYLPDTDLVTGEADSYISYVGNGRRIITVPIVNALATNAAATMTVLGFWLFFLEPNPDGSYVNPAAPHRSSRVGSTTTSGLAAPSPYLPARESWCCTNDARAQRQHGSGSGDVDAGALSPRFRRHPARQDHLPVLHASQDRVRHRALGVDRERRQLLPRRQRHLGPGGH